MEKTEAKLPLDAQNGGATEDNGEQNEQAGNTSTTENMGDENLATELAQLKAQIAKQKNDFDKVMHENGTLRKKLKEKQTAEEAEAEAKAEEQAAKEAYVKGLERKIAVIDATSRYQELGMGKELALETANAEVDGDREKVNSNMAKYHAEWKKAAEAELKQKYLANMADFQSGNNANVDFTKQFNEALGNNDTQGAILAQIQMARANGAAT